MKSTIAGKAQTTPESHYHYFSDPLIASTLAFGTTTVLTSIDPTAATICAATAVVTYKVVKPWITTLLSENGYAKSTDIGKNVAFISSIAGGLTVPNALGYAFTLSNTANVAFNTTIATLGVAIVIDKYFLSNN